jgi:hypothetical protein
MRYQAFSRACRALGISAESFRDLHTLAMALEQSVDAGNARTIVRLLSQMTGDFDIHEARRAFSTARDAAWTVQAWSSINDDVGDCSFFLGEGRKMRRWLMALPSDLRQSILTFFESPPHRFMLAADPFGGVKLGVQDAKLELSYFLPARFVLDPAPAKAAVTARELLRHLRIGTLYHELLGMAGEGIDVSTILALLAGEPAAMARAHAVGH